MASRELTPEEEARLLTPEQLRALPEETPIMVLWHNGNGPHRYVASHWRDMTVAYIPAPHWHVVALIRAGPNRSDDRVFLPEAG